MGTTGPVGFLGLSHLGLVYSTVWASRGNSVLGVDPDPDTIALLEQSRLPVQEPGLQELFCAVRSRMTFSSNVAALARCPLVFLSRDVPVLDDNQSDLSGIEDLIERVIPRLSPGAVLVIMSQVPPGFTRTVSSKIRRDRPADGPVLYYLVETLILGRAVERGLHPERMILGCDDPKAPLPAVLERGLREFDCPILKMRYESAELTKTAINLYLASSVTYANTLSDLCEGLCADWSEVTPALRLDARIGRDAYLRPSLGIAGGNLERDLVTLRRLAAEHNVDGRFIATILEHNARRPRWILDKLDALVFAETRRPTVAIWGLAYKRGTQSTKNSTALRVIDGLGGRAIVKAYDPVVRAAITDRSVTIVQKRDDALVEADCLLITTDWEDFQSVDPLLLQRVMRRPLLIDCVGMLQNRRDQLKGIHYVSMGSCAES